MKPYRFRFKTQVRWPDTDVKEHWVADGTSGWSYVGQEGGFVKFARAGFRQCWVPLSNVAYVEVDDEKAAPPKK